MSTKRNVILEMLDTARARLPYLSWVISLVWAAARRWTIIWFILLIIQGILPVATVYLTRSLVDSLVLSLGTTPTWESFRPTLLLVILMAGVLLMGEILRSVTTYVRTAQAELVKDHISHLIHAQSLAVDLAFFDSPDYYDRLHRARYEATTQPLSRLDNIGSLFQNSLTLGAMVLVLIPYGWWLPFALIFSSLPAFYMVLRHRLRLHRWRLTTTAAERKAWYYFWLLTAREAAAEMRLFGLGPLFRERYQKLRSSLRVERLRLARDQSLVELGAGLSALLVTGLTMAWMVWRTVQGLFSLGDLALFYSAFNQGQRLTRSMLEHLGEMYSNSLFLADLHQFLTVMPVVTAPAEPLAVPVELQSGLEFKDVFFRYPDSQRAVLSNFNLRIPAGRIVAVVGANGAGKSTLVKLLCRLYDPAEGRLTIDGVDMRSFDPAELQRRITVLFQQPVYYNETVAENIGFGDLSIPFDGPEIEAAARAAGADQPIAHLPDGYSTLLGKWFKGGSDLSVGEWQRIALARAYLRQAPIMVLDEPTSAMDPWAETDWLRRFRRLAEGRTALIITHRFTTAMYADVIHVMDAGKVIESGSHEELLATNGRYAESWNDQNRRRHEGG